MQKKYVYILVFVALVAGAIAAVKPVLNANTPAEKSQLIDNELVADQDSAIAEFKWNSVMESIELQKTSKKKLFIDVYTTWCGPCKMLDANTFSNPVIRKILSEYYIPTKFNAESGDSILFQGQTFRNPNYSPQP